VIFWCTV